MQSRSLKVNVYKEYLETLDYHGITVARVHRKSIHSLPRLFRNAMGDLKLSKTRLCQWMALYETRAKHVLWCHVERGLLKPSYAIALLGMDGEKKQLAAQDKLGGEKVTLLLLPPSGEPQVEQAPVGPSPPTHTPPPAPTGDLDQQVRTAFAEAAATIRGLKSDKGASGHLALHVYYANGKVKKVAREFGDQIDVDVADAFAKEQVTQGKLIQADEKLRTLLQSCQQTRDN